MPDPFGGASPGETQTVEGKVPSPSPTNSTVVIGPVNAGKSFLIAALQRACTQSGGNGFRLRFIPKTTNQGTQIADLIKSAINLILKTKRPDAAAGDTLKATDKDPIRYLFELHCTRLDWWNRIVSLSRSIKSEVSFVDAGGGILFPEANQTLNQDEIPARRQMVNELKECRNVIICINSLTPKTALFYQEFPKLIAEAGGELQAERVLLLLTQADEKVRSLKTEVHAMASQSNFHGTIAFEALEKPTLTDKRLMSLIDPIDFALMTLDQACVSMIRRSLRPDAQMAVGVCSSTGFYDEGKAFWNAATIKPEDRPSFTEDEQLSHWKPYGVEEAILFLLIGRASRRTKLIRSYGFIQDRIAASDRRRQRILCLEHKLVAN